MVVAAINFRLNDSFYVSKRNYQHSVHVGDQIFLFSFCEQLLGRCDVAYNCAEFSFGRFTPKQQRACSDKRLQLTRNRFLVQKHYLHC